MGSDLKHIRLKLPLILLLLKLDDHHAVNAATAEKGNGTGCSTTRHCAKPPQIRDVGAAPLAAVPDVFALLQNVDQDK